MAINLMGLVIQIIVSVIILAPVLWLVGRGLVGKEKARGTDALWIVVLGVILQNVVHEIFAGLIPMLPLGFLVRLLSWLFSFILTLLVWLFLIHHFFDCGWLMAFAIAVVTVIAFIIVSIIVAIVLGIGLLFLVGAV